MKGKAIIFSAPSGAGKTTIVHHLIKKFDELRFSISACSRMPRSGEEDGKDYHFIGLEGFKSKIEESAFVEWEEVYSNNFYGTLKSEIDSIWEDGKVVIFDVDVIGGINLKQYFGENALSIFVMPPDKEELEKRLRGRATETEDKIQQRLNKAAVELDKAPKFDIQLINDDLNTALKEAEALVKDFIG